MSGKSPKRQESLLIFFKPLGQLDPKQAKIVSENQQCGDGGGHSCTSSSSLTVGLLVLLVHLSARMIPYVRSWIAKERRTARDLRSRESSREMETRGSMDAVWAVLEK